MVIIITRVETENGNGKAITMPITWLYPTMVRDKNVASTATREKAKTATGENNNNNNGNHDEMVITTVSVYTLLHKHTL